MTPRNVILNVVKDLWRMQVITDIHQRFLVVILLGMTVMVTPAYAADSTPSADTKAKLEALKQEIASKAAELKKEVNLKLQNKAFVGNLKLKSENSLTLASPTGSKIISLNQDTEYTSRVKKIKYSFKNLTEEDYIAALGDIDDTGVLTAKKIILLPKPESEEKQILWGQIISISNKLITIKDKALKNHSLLVSQTDVDSLTLNDFVIVTGFLSDNGIIDTQFIYVIPQGGFLKKEKKLASPSAEIATKSASPSAKKK